MRIEAVSYSTIASVGLDGVVRDYCGRRDFIAVGCHKGERRSGAAVRNLIAANIPVANSEVIPSINYADFTDYKFDVSDLGVSIPGKTDFPFAHLLLFQDGSHEEHDGIQKIKKLLKVEARGVLQSLLVAEMRDEGGLWAIA